MEESLLIQFSFQAYTKIYCSTLPYGKDEGVKVDWLTSSSPSKVKPERREEEKEVVVS